jgi:hypothetical protein
LAAELPVAQSGARCSARVLEWKPQQFLIAHGECAMSGATEIIEAALSWI